MYVCGPTVYDRPHLGNARSIVVYDLFYRFFLQIFDQVIYVRNITDVDDKINARAKELNIPISKLTKNITDKIVLVTGAGGSIGSELCRQILAVKPQTLLLIEQSEYALYEIHQELEV